MRWGVNSVAYLATHLVAWDGNEKEVSLIGIEGAESTLPNVLEEIALTGVLSGELPRRLVKRFGIPIWVYVNLEPLLHLSVIQLEHARGMIHVTKLFIIITFFLSASRIDKLCNWDLWKTKSKRAIKKTSKNGKFWNGVWGFFVFCTWGGEGVEYLRERKVKERRVRIARVRSEPRREKRLCDEDCCWDCFPDVISIGFHRLRLSLVWGFFNC